MVTRKAILTQKKQERRFLTSVLGGKGKGINLATCGLGGSCGSGSVGKWRKKRCLCAWQGNSVHNVRASEKGFLASFRDVQAQQRMSMALVSPNNDHIRHNGFGLATTCRTKFVKSPRFGASDNAPSHKSSSVQANRFKPRGAFE